MSDDHIVLIGPTVGMTPAERAEDERLSDVEDELLDRITVALQPLDTRELLAIADRRRRIHPDGWMERLIREYVDVWR